VSHGFYLAYDGAFPAVPQLRRFWEAATAAAGLVERTPWERTGDVVEQVAGGEDCDVELAVFLEGELAREVSVEGHWSAEQLPAAYRSVLDSAQSFAAATGGHLEDFDAGASLP
jgi:hypothetical protein